MFGHEYSVNVDEEAAAEFAESVGSWPQFTDSAEALE